MNKTHLSRALVALVVALVVSFGSIVGGTIAWFTSEVESTGNIIKSGTLKVGMEWATAPDATNWTDASTGAIFTHDNWEPGYTDVKYIKIANDGTLAFKYQFNILPTAEAADGEADLAKVIDVYYHEYVEDDTWTASRALTGMNYAGTMADLMKTTVAQHGTLKAGEETKVAIALKMQESAGNEYQGLSVGEGFRVQLLATQLASEQDGFGNSDYDVNATYSVDNWNGESDTEFEKDPEDANVLYITSAEELAGLAKEVNAGDAKKGLTYKLTTNIDLGGKEWEPIGVNGFSALFDGQGYTISNYVVNAKQNAGLFGYLLNGGNVINLTVADATVTANDYAGAIVGRGYVKMENCHAENVTVTVMPFLMDGTTKYDGGAKAGGVIGQLMEGANYIKNCSAKNVTINGYRDIGGVLGMLHTGNSISGCTAENVTINYVKMTGMTMHENKINENAGLIVGRNNPGATVENNTPATVGEVPFVYSAGMHVLPDVTNDKVVITGTKDVVIAATLEDGRASGSDLELNGVTIQGVVTGSVNGFINVDDSVYNDCTIKNSLVLYGDEVTFNDCTFEFTASDYVWTYGANKVTFNNCTFNTAGKAILLFGYQNGAEVVVKDCTFNSTAAGYAYAISNQPCAAIEIDNTTLTEGNKTYTLTTSGNTYADTFSGEWRIKSIKEPVVVNGKTYNSVAVDGVEYTVTDRVATKK